MSPIHLFPTKQGELAYKSYGTGAKHMLAFHGFGQDHKVFSSLEEPLSNEYTIYSFDLYFHGASTWKNGDNPLSKNEWQKTIELFLAHKGIETFSILAFSLGGKFALTSIELFEYRVNKVILLAPDGIATSFWYSLATYPIVFQKYFKSLIDQPKRFFRIIHLLRKIGIVDKGILKFAATQMSTQQQRSRVYYSWIIFKQIKPDLNRVADAINRHKIFTQIYLGKYDKIITQGSIKNFLSKIPNHKLTVLPCGHNQLIQNVRDFLFQNP